MNRWIIVVDLYHGKIACESIEMVKVKNMATGILGESKIAFENEDTRLKDTRRIIYFFRWRGDR